MVYTFQIFSSFSFTLWCFFSYSFSSTYHLILEYLCWFWILINYHNIWLRSVFGKYFIVSSFSLLFTIFGEVSFLVFGGFMPYTLSRYSASYSAVPFSVYYFCLPEAATIAFLHNLCLELCLTQQMHLQWTWYLLLCSYNQC